MKNITRNSFLRHSLLGLGGIALAPPLLRSQQNQKPPPISPEIVKEFVGKSHGDFDRIREMLENEPGLLQVAWDWGGGDFETGLGAGSHVGHKEIASYLLEKGAPINLFTAAMLGNISLVKSIIEAYPGQLHTKGPHGLSLMHHAKKGGDEALAVVEYLQSMGVEK